MSNLNRFGLLDTIDLNKRRLSVSESEVEVVQRHKRSVQSAIDRVTKIQNYHPVHMQQ
jgi:hypothetical protein